MATMKLVPSDYDVSSTYLSVSSASSMYDDCDSTDYATITNTRSGTTSYYLYIKGFDFDSLPSQAVVMGWTVRIRARESGISTSTSYGPKLCHGTSQITSTCDAITTTATTHEFTSVGIDWADAVEYGSEFGIRLNCRRSSRNTTGYMYVYGAEIEVEYTVPNPRTVTTSLTGEGTITPSGSTTTYDGETFELTIVPTDVSDEVTVTRDGADVTSQLVAHYPGDTATFTPDDVRTSGIQSGSSYASYCVGHSAESPSSSGTSSNMYASSGSTGYAEYSFDFSQIPSNATVESVEVRCYGHRESSTIDSSHVSQCVLYGGSYAISDEVDFPSTSNGLITVTPTSTPTRSELADVTLRHFVGYYGGLVLGISFEVVYSTGGMLDHYTYTFEVSGDSTVKVVIGAAGPELYVKRNGVWVQVSRAYRKVSGSWQEVALDQAFESGVNYVMG